MNYKTSRLDKPRMNTTWPVDSQAQFRIADLGLRIADLKKHRA